MFEYRGFWFTAGTSETICNIIANNLHGNSRIRIFLGDENWYWLEEYDIMGYIGRSTGIKKIPLLLNNRKSIGGSGILTHCIQQITINKIIVYKNPKWRIKEFTTAIENEKITVFYDGKIQACFNTEIQAKNYIEFMQGKRNKK